MFRNGCRVLCLAKKIGFGASFPNTIAPCAGKSWDGGDMVRQKRAAAAERSRQGVGGAGLKLFPGRHYPPGICGRSCEKRVVPGYIWNQTDIL